LKARYEFLIEDKTPDWCVFDRESCLVGIIELTNFYIDMQTQSQIAEQLVTKHHATYVRDGNKNNIDRLYFSISEKAQKYKELVTRLGIPYVVSVFIDFKLAIDQEEIQHCLYANETGLFRNSNGLSGVLFFQENNGCYYFKYEKNSNASESIDLPDFALDLHQK
jgi:hypothetical protein